MGFENYKRTKEQYKKIVESRKWYSHNEETRKKISDHLRGRDGVWTGKHLPEYMKEKISKTLTGRKMPEEQKAKVSLSIRNSEKHKLAMKSKERSEKLSKAFTGRKISEEQKIKISNTLKGRRLSEEAMEHLRAAIKRRMERGGPWLSPESRKKLSDSKKKHITINEIVENFKNILKYEGRLTKSELVEKMGIRRICSRTKIKSVLREYNKTLDEIIEENNLPVEKRDARWRQKEELGIELCKELYGEGDVKPYYKSKDEKSFPDFVPEDKEKPIVEIKSRIKDVNIQQYDKYTNIRKDVRVMVFDTDGATDLPKDKILYMKEIIKTLPDGKKVFYQEKYERIKNVIPKEQTSLSEVIKKE